MRPEYDSVMSIRVAVITVSDRAANSTYVDRSGPAARQVFLDAGHDVGDVRVVSDDPDAIVAAIRQAIAEGARLVLTTGGTGIAPRDRTPEATARLGGQEIPGIGEAIRAKGAAHTPMAMLTRGLAVVVRDGVRPAIVINAPGSMKGAKEGAEVVSGILDHLVAQIDGTDRTH